MFFKPGLLSRISPSVHRGKCQDYCKKLKYNTTAQQFSHLAFTGLRQRTLHSNKKTKKRQITRHSFGALVSVPLLSFIRGGFHSPESFSVCSVSLHIQMCCSGVLVNLHSRQWMLSHCIQTRSQLHSYVYTKVGSDAGHL